MCSLKAIVFCGVRHVRGDSGCLQASIADLTYCPMCRSVSGLTRATILYESMEAVKRLVATAQGHETLAYAVVKSQISPMVV